MSTPFLQLERGNYISRLWFFYRDGVDFDVLMALTRRLPDGDWLLKYRFRYYRDDKAFDSKDEKSFWTATFSEKLDEAAAVRKVSPIIQKLKVMTRLDFDVLTIESDDPKLALHLMRQKNFMHMKIQEMSS